MARYLVTGAAGFIGSHICERLVQNGEEVVALDNLSSGRLENVAAFKDKLDWHNGDIREAERVLQLAQGVDYIIHQAAIPSVPESVNNPTETADVNVYGTNNILEAARQHSVKRVVQASSSAIYGDDPVLPKKEDMYPLPLSPYAASKIQNEMSGIAYYKSYGLEYVALRYFNVFGPRQNPKSQYAAVIPNFIRAYLENKKPIIYGDGLQTRDFCYVDNIVTANIAACRQEGIAGEAINIACQEKISLLELLCAIDAKYNDPAEIQFEDARVGDIKHSYTDISKAESLLKYNKEIHFADGLKQTIDYYRE